VPQFEEREKSGSCGADVLVWVCKTTSKKMKQNKALRKGD
jgi:hypothetical protein